MSKGSDSLPTSIIITAIFIVLLIGTILGVYFFNFNGSLGDNNAFGTFGDYVGGLLNPILSFFTIGLLIWSLRLQAKELDNSRRELKASTDALVQTKNTHEKNLSLQQGEILRKQLQDDFEYHWERYLMLYNKKIFKGLTFVRKGSPPPEKKSINEIINIDSHDIADNAFIKSIPDRMKGMMKSNIATITLLEMNAELYYMVETTRELFKLLQSPVIARSIQTRLTPIIDEQLHLKMIEQDAYERVIKHIELPNHLNEEEKK